MVKFFNYIDITKENFSFNNKQVIIWGKGFSALALYVELYAGGVAVIGFIDSFVNTTGEKFAGLPVFTYEEVKKMERIVIYISTQNLDSQRTILEYIQDLNKAIVLCRGTVYGAAHYDINETKQIISENAKEIKAVREALYDEKSIQTFDNLLKYFVSNQKHYIEEIYEKGHEQYFPQNEILKKSKDEVFIDAGAYNGNTSYCFSRWVEGKYSKIYAMEPDEIMFQVLKEYVKLQGLNSVYLVNKGAYSYATELAFNSDILTGSSTVEKNGKTTISTISIDRMLNGEKATFIKMDIEGTEMEALVGAQYTIKKFKPKLAISIYHKISDLWLIPYYIIQQYPWYKIYMRHYTPLTTETVLYATI